MVPTSILGPIDIGSASDAGCVQHHSGPGQFGHAALEFVDVDGAGKAALIVRGLRIVPPRVGERLQDGAEDLHDLVARRRR